MALVLAQAQAAVTVQIVLETEGVRQAVDHALLRKQRCCVVDGVHMQAKHATGISMCMGLRQWMEGCDGGTCQQQWCACHQQHRL